MQRLSTPLLAAAALFALVSAFFGDALFRGGQFDYRDAEHFYYPLYQRVQAEWDAGRWPLWEPEENAGMPLLGQPTAAVLYPPKVVYAIMPYPWAARIYIVLHVVIAVSGMAIMARSLGISGVGATLAGLSYGFGVPVVFQYCNVIFLVGAAWAPFGLRAVEAWLGRGRTGALFELAAVLALETLGGDPETAYVTGLCAAGYALILARSRRPAGASWSWPRVAIVGMAGVAAWTAAVLVASHVLPGYRAKPAPGRPPIILPWVKYVPMTAAAAWAIVGAIVVRRWRRGRSALGPGLAGLAAAAALAAGLAAAQLVPVLEFTGQTGRAADQALDDIYAFSLDPGRLIELAWPNVHGDDFSGNTDWLLARPQATAHPKTWVPSLYIGGLTLVLGLGALIGRDRAPWRRWLAGIAAVGLLGSMGDHAGPLLWARQSHVLEGWIGSRDMKETASLRDDGNLRDGDGSVYWAMATAFPGFHSFRYPSKLLTFTALSLAALAGAGWDATRRGDGPRRLATALVGASGAALVVVLAARGPIVAAFDAWAAGARGSFGPLDPEGAYRGIVAAVGQGGAMAAVAWALIRVAPRRPGVAGALAVAAMAVDLALANPRYISTCPQSVFEETPEVLRLIREAERDDPSPGPFRIHRMPSWAPLGWYEARSGDRVREFATWQRRTLQPKHGINDGLQFALTLGTAELYDYSWFLSAFYWAPTPDFAASLNVAPGDRVTYYTRRGFDMWGARYFVLPYYTPAGWRDEQRGIASFLFDARRLHPAPDAFAGPDGRARMKSWVDAEDFQILRNNSAYPRSWVVHQVRRLGPISGMSKDDRQGPMQEILYNADPVWNDPNSPLYDPRSVAWIEAEQFRDALGRVSNTPADPAEAPTVSEYGPQRVRIDATLRRPGLVILADVFYPGWRLTIDGEAAPIYRVNRAMRGAFVASGTHRLVYTYDPASFRVGAAASLLALPTWLVGWIVSTRRSRARADERGPKLGPSA